MITSAALTVSEGQTVTLANAKKKMTFAGEFEEAEDDSATTFLQWDLGYRRQDPALYGKAWKRKRDKLLDLLASGPITISAGQNSYTIPGAAIPDWLSGLAIRCPAASDSCWTLGYGGSGGASGSSQLVKNVHGCTT